MMMSMRLLSSLFSSFPISSFLSLSLSLSLPPSPSHLGVCRGERDDATRKSGKKKSFFFPMHLAASFFRKDSERGRGGRKKEEKGAFPLFFALSHSLFTFTVAFCPGEREGRERAGQNNQAFSDRRNGFSPPLRTLFLPSCVILRERDTERESGGILSIFEGRGE